MTACICVINTKQASATIMYVNLYFPLMGTTLAIFRRLCRSPKVRRHGSQSDVIQPRGGRPTTVRTWDSDGVVTVYSPLLVGQAFGVSTGRLPSQFAWPALLLLRLDGQPYFPIQRSSFAAFGIHRL